MKAIYLVRKGAPEKAFEFREVNIPQPREGQVLIKVEGFGLNFADIVAREGMYKEAPPMPSVIGYDIVGRVEAMGNGVVGFEKGTLGKIYRVVFLIGYSLRWTIFSVDLSV